MASWPQFETSAPEFGAAARRLLVGADGVAIGFLATVSSRGNPHLSPVCPIFAGEQLYLSAGAHTPKAADLRSFTGVTQVAELGGGRFRLHCADGADPRESLAELAARNNWGLLELRAEGKTLEEIFVELTSGDEARETEDAA